MSVIQIGRDPQSGAPLFVDTATGKQVNANDTPITYPPTPNVNPDGSPFIGDPSNSKYQQMLTTKNGKTVNVVTLVPPPPPPPPKPAPAPAPDIFGLIGQFANQAGHAVTDFVAGGGLAADAAAIGKAASSVVSGNFAGAGQALGTIVDVAQRTSTAAMVQTLQDSGVPPDQIAVAVGALPFSAENKQAGVAASSGKPPPPKLSSGGVPLLLVAGVALVAVVFLATGGARRWL